MKRTTAILPEISEAQTSKSAQRRQATSPSTTVAAVTDVGRVREHNEDAVYVSDDGRVMIVADGMGGHAAGEVASRLAVEALIEFMSEDRLRQLEGTPETIAGTLKKAILQAHDRVLEGSKGWGERRGMGTTLILAVLLHGRVFTCHVGDVRGYILTVAGLQQMTRDHSLVGDLVRRGLLTAEEARRHPRRNEILQALGLPMPILPEVNARPLTDGDLILICSDGLVEDLSDHDMAEALTTNAPALALATNLVDKALVAGGRDNISIVLCRYGQMRGTT